ncbi:MAG: YidB family protein [Methylacidiphilales bacterium]|nr:YidB family protein [Candidatus Methylacidiphilales bacterium]
MGLFDEVLGGLEAQAGQHAALYEEVASLVTQSGGVNGLIQQFEQQGLGQLVSGWVGGASNTPISPDQLVQAIGQDKITSIASKVGMSESQVTDGISKLLPLMVGHLTPNGTAPTTGGGQLETEALGLLKSKLFGS